jgi:outer membrane lipoprotein-sorting protein
MSTITVSRTAIVGLVLMVAALQAAAAPTSAAKPTAAATPAPKEARAPSLPALTAAQIVERNVTARGGLAAWKAVQTMSWKGKMGAGGTTYMTVSPKGKLEQKEREETQLPYRLEFKRPGKSRLELDFNGQTAVQVYDGVKGWKYRPYLGRDEWTPYSADELRLAAAEPGIDGYLIDYASKGATVELAGTDKVEGHAAYVLKVTRKDGQVRRVWVDGQSFLELKVDGAPRKLDGRLHAVEVYPRDYKQDQGLMIPHLQETTVEGVKKTEKVTIENVTVNAPLDDARFTNADSARLTNAK